MSDEEPKPQCGTGGGVGEDYDFPLHTGAIFMVLAASILGCGFPVAAKKIKWLKMPEKVFFACKHFGTGVLVATAFVHLVPTAFENLTDDCLPDLFTDIYPAMPGAIMMVSMFSLFVIEMWLNAKTGGHSHGGATGKLEDAPPMPAHMQQMNHLHNMYQPERPRRPSTDSDMTLPVGMALSDNEKPYNKGQHQRTKSEEAEFEANFLKVSAVADQPMPAWFVVFYEQYIRERMEMTKMIKDAGVKGRNDFNNYSKSGPDVNVSESHFDQEGQQVDPQLLKRMNLNISLLEGGILFHSVFVGITVSLTNEGFLILLIAILFHQMFEGIGLGSRIAAVPYPKSSIRPWVLVVAFGTTAPLGMAIGLGARDSYDEESAYGLIINGAFNAFSSGLLIYAALVDLLAEDFLSEESQRTLTGRTRTEAFMWVLFGAIAMSVIGAFA